MTQIHPLLVYNVDYAAVSVLPFTKSFNVHATLDTTSLLDRTV